MPTEIVNDEFLKLSIARYQGDDKYLKDLNENFKVSLDTLDWHKLKDTPDLYRFSVDNQILKAGVWRRNRIQGTNQKVYETTIPIDQLPPGTYTLKIEKLIVAYDLLSNSPEGIKLREHWDEIDFIKK